MPKIPDARTPFAARGGVASFVVARKDAPRVEADDSPNFNPTRPALGVAPPISSIPGTGGARDTFDPAAPAANTDAGPTVSGRPPSTPHLVYWGGRVLTQPKVVNVFIGDYWKTPAGEGDAAHMNGFAASFGKSAMFDLLSPQYGVGRPDFGGSVVVPGTPARMTKEDIEAAVKNALAAGGLPTDPETVYSVQLPPNTVLAEGTTDSTQGLGGFHGSYLDANNKPVYYCAIAYADAEGKNGINFSPNPRDNNTITLSHELVEAITDPDVAQAKEYSDLGYMDPRGGEIGDLAVNDGGLPLNEAFARDAHGYAVQLEWDNQTSAFAIGPAKAAKLLTATGHNPVNAALGPAESQSVVTLHKAIDVSKLTLTVTLDNPKGGRPAMTLTTPSGRAIPINLPPVPNYHGTLDLSPFLAGENAKGPWVLSATDPTKTGMTLKNWAVKAEGIAEGATTPP